MLYCILLFMALHSTMWWTEQLTVCLYDASDHEHNDNIPEPYRSNYIIQIYTCKDFLTIIYN